MNLLWFSVALIVFVTSGTYAKTTIVESSPFAVSVAGAKDATSTCLLAYPNGLLNQVAFQLYGPDFFKLDEMDYPRNFHPVFMDDDRKTFGANPNPKFFTIDSLDHDFVSFYQKNNQEMSEIHFSKKIPDGKLQIQKVHLNRVFPSIGYQIIQDAQVDSEGNKIPNTEILGEITITFDFENIKIMMNDKEVFIPLTDYAFCLIKEIRKHKVSN